MKKKKIRLKGSSLLKRNKPLNKPIKQKVKTKIVLEN